MATQYVLTHLTKEHDSFNIYSDCQAAIYAITSHTRESYCKNTISLIRENLTEISLRISSIKMIHISYNRIDRIIMAETDYMEN